MYNPIKQLKQSVADTDRRRRIEYAESKFNIKRIDGIDYITINGVVVSRGSDNDILERLAELRDRYIND